MFDSVWSRVVADSYNRREAILQGYDRKCVRNESYPVIVPSSRDSQIQGLVYENVSRSDLVRLDQFEGEYYVRKSLQVVTLDMATLPAEVYVLKEEYYSIISHGEWCSVQFSSVGIHSFIHRYMGGEKQ